MNYADVCQTLPLTITQDICIVIAPVIPSSVRSCYIQMVNIGDATVLTAGVLKKMNQH